MKAPMSREFIVTSAEVAASLVIRMLIVLWNSVCLNEAEAGAETDEQPVVCLEGCVWLVGRSRFVLFLRSLERILGFDV